MVKRIGRMLSAALVLAACSGSETSNPESVGDAQASADAPASAVLDAPASEVTASVEHAPDHATADGSPQTIDGGAELAPPDAHAWDAAGADAGVVEGGAEVSAGDGGTEAGSTSMPLCGTADSRGFFASCSACAKPDDCDEITVGGRTRSACGCSTAACPCGLRCGCSDVAPGVRVCNICVR